MNRSLPDVVDDESNKCRTNSQSLSVLQDGVLIFGTNMSSTNLFWSYRLWKTRL